MNSTKVNWVLLVLFCVLAVVFCILLILTPANGDKINTIGRIGLWLGIIANVANAITQAFEIRRKRRENQ